MPLDQPRALRCVHDSTYHVGVGTFTKAGADELAPLAIAFGLGELERHRAIEAGTINSNYELVTTRGRFFLRINEGKREADVAWEAALVTALAAAGVATPPPLVARATNLPYAPFSDGKWVSVFPWRDGHHVSAVTAAHARAFGGALAELHVAGLALPFSWRRPSIYDHDHIVARFESFAQTRDRELAHAIAILGEELAIARDAMPIRARATQGIIHGDLFRDNVLWQAERIAAILDFEQASGGSLAYDLAVCINDWCYPALDLARSLVAGYEHVRPLPAADREALPYEIRAAAARFTITRITDVYLANVPNPAKDFRDFLSRCEAWRSPALGELTRAV